MSVFGIGGAGLGWQELLIIFFIILLLFGAKRLPEMAKSLGKAKKEFEDATKDFADDVKSGMKPDDAGSGEPTSSDRKTE